MLTSDSTKQAQVSLLLQDRAEPEQKDFLATLLSGNASLYLLLTYTDMSL
jgi:hypothetical protein